ncbi:MAG: glycosyltransferase family 39 protein [Chloroflexi bacterium]|nr:glycosyltransferase family 39 protein [Chloroflexota bacterium]MCC6892377.1 glycosyltransferase family 39 protein [Anaerolineae bacterium]
MPNKPLVSILAVLLVGAVLRFHALGQDARFHPDEALFVTFARQAAVQGDWLLHGSLDKPPLTIYINALALTAFGITPLPDGVLTLDVHRGEFAARVPGLFASLLLIALVYVLAKRVFPRDACTPVAAALLVALSPLAVAFSATAFTDGLLLLCLALALWMGSRRRWLWAGVWLVAGLWCKQQAVLYVPLVLAVGWACERRFKQHLTVIKIARFIIPILLGFMLLLVWDSAREQSTGMWALATTNNDPGRLARLDELLPRLAAWWQYAGYLFGSPLITAALLFIGGIGLISITYAAYRESHVVGTAYMLSGTRKITFQGIFTLYILIYALIHWLVAINIYDRYLLLTLPPLVLVVARGIIALLDQYRVGSRYQAILLIAIGCVMLPSAWAASEGQMPIGGDRGKHNGIEQVADYLNSQRLGAIVYDHWLGWELGYYMGTWSDKRRVYYPTSEAFAADALLQPDRAPRYFVVPAWADVSAWLDALRQSGFSVTRTYDQAPFAVYELLPP